MFKNLYNNGHKTVSSACVSLHQWAEYILFASLLVLVCIIFAIMAYFYTYIDPAKIEAHFADFEEGDDKKRKSLEMVKQSEEQHSQGRRSSNSSSSSSSSSDNEETRQTKI